MTHIAMALQRHAQDESVALYAYTAITNLTHGSMENCSRLRETGGLPVFVSSFRSEHQDSAKVMRQACLALLTLAASEEVAVDLVKLGIGSALLDTMLSFG